MKKIVRYIGGRVRNMSQVWGGTIATNYAIVKAMANHPDFDFQARFRRQFGGMNEVKQYLKGAHITHVDDTLMISRIHAAGMAPPNVIGPITRSPIKNYQGWIAPYPAGWFYRARIIRLNYSEEPGAKERVTLIRHGVDTELLCPSKEKKRKYVLWAGDAKRRAKNFPMMQEIMNTALPPGYEFKVMTNYAVRDYWRILDETALVVNTSKWESFCCAAFEAMAKGVPVIWRKGLQGGVHEQAGVRVDYDLQAYSRAIMDLLDGRKYESLMKVCRDYVKKNASLAAMRDDLSRIYAGVKA